MSKFVKTVLASLFFLQASVALPNGSSVISSIEYLYLVKSGTVPTLIVVTSDNEVETLTTRAQLLKHLPLSVRLDHTPITMKLKPRPDGLGLMGHLDGWGYRVLVVSRSQAEKYL